MGFGDRLKGKMREKGYGVADLAAKVPVEPNSVSRWRAGHVPGPVYLERVAALLDCTTGFLKDGEIDFPPGTMAGHQDTPEASPSVQGSVTSDPSPSDTDRPPLPQLPEPAIPLDPEEWDATTIVYLALRDNIRSREASKEDPLLIRALRFWGNRLTVAHYQDKARAETARRPNGGHATG